MQNKGFMRFFVINRKPGPESAKIAICTWEKQVFSAGRFKRVGRHSEYAI
jgi:hypothetical protein